jgi:hypothetical protein
LASFCYNLGKYGPYLLSSIKHWRKNYPIF